MAQVVWTIIYTISTALCYLITILAVNSKKKRIEFIFEHAANTIFIFPVSIFWDFCIISVVMYTCNDFLWLQVLLNIINLFVFSWGAVFLIMLIDATDIDELNYYFEKGGRNMTLTFWTVLYVITVILLFLMQTFSIQNKAKRKEFLSSMIPKIFWFFPLFTFCFMTIIASFMYSAIISFENPFWAQMISNIVCLVFCSVGTINLFMSAAFYCDIDYANRRYFGEDWLCAVFHKLKALMVHVIIKNNQK